MIRTEKKKRKDLTKKSKAEVTIVREGAKKGRGRSATGEGGVEPGGAQEAGGGGAATVWDRGTGTLHNCRYMYCV